MRALVVSNLYPKPESPRLGRFVFDQVSAIRDLGCEVDVFDFPLGSRAYAAAVSPLRAKLRTGDYDVVHAHYGLCGWVAERAGARPLAVTFHGTDVRHPVVGRISRHVARRADLAAGASSALFRREGGRRGLPLVDGAAVLPCGVDTERFRPLDRLGAREELGLDPDGRYLLLPADPERPVKRADRAREVATRANAELLTAGEVEPERMPTLINASDAVLISSDSEGFGLAALEALACGVPVLATPVGAVPVMLAGQPGCLVSDFEASTWAAFAESAIAADAAIEPDRPALERFSAENMARRVLAAWEGLVADEDPALGLREVA